ncbi:MAG: class III extradiol ring-cleavage dioxygenase [Betaproteobacteria bacterium]|nr:class III extradiol ring-cleavage dioxygenase [Betaproteobacteria bacterium]
MSRLPVVFVSHGAPDALLKAPEAVACWRQIGRDLPRPSAILAVSAHWEARQPTASLSGAPETIHDFSGFSPALHAMQYLAPGAPALAERVVSLLSAAGNAAALHPTRGLDHGAWVPLSAMFPAADVPVTQLSLVRDAGPAAHVALGQALAPLRDEGVLIVATGSITHNFDWLDWQGAGDPAPQAEIFADWVAERAAAGDVAGLLGYRAAPHGAAAHPTEEHFLPFFVALGAAAGDRPVRHRPPFAYGGLAMDAYVWPAAGP